MHGASYVGIPLVYPMSCLFHFSLLFVLLQGNGPWDTTVPIQNPRGYKLAHGPPSTPQEKDRGTLGAG